MLVMPLILLSLSACQKEGESPFEPMMMSEYFLSCFQNSFSDPKEVILDVHYLGDQGQWHTVKTDYFYYTGFSNLTVFAKTRTYYDDSLVISYQPNMGDSDPKEGIEKDGSVLQSPAKPFPFFQCELPLLWHGEDILSLPEAYRYDLLDQADIKRLIESQANQEYASGFDEVVREQEAKIALIEPTPKENASSLRAKILNDAYAAVQEKKGKELAIFGVEGWFAPNHILSRDNMRIADFYGDFHGAYVLNLMPRTFMEILEEGENGGNRFYYTANSGKVPAPIYLPTYQQEDHQGVVVHVAERGIAFPSQSQVPIVYHDGIFSSLEEAYADHLLNEEDISAIITARDDLYLRHERADQSELDRVV